MLPVPRSSNKNVIFSPIRKTITANDIFSQEVGQSTRSPGNKYPEPFSPTDVNAEIQAIERLNQKVSYLGERLDEIALTLRGLFVALDNPLVAFAQFEKHEDYKRIIADSKKNIENLKQEIKSARFGAKSFRDPTNSKYVVSQKAIYDLSDRLLDKIKAVDYRADSANQLCDVLLELEREEMHFRRIYQSDKPTCQVKVMEKVDALFAALEKEKKDNKEIEKEINNCCKLLNQLIVEYIQMKTRVQKLGENNEVYKLLGPLFRHFLEKADTQHTKCVMWSEKICKQRYLGSPVEGQIERLDIEGFQDEFKKFMDKIVLSYTNVDEFLQHIQERETLQSRCRNKSNALKECSAQLIHEKTANKITRYVMILGVIDDNLTLLDECTNAAGKIKATFEHILKPGNADPNQAGMKTHFKDERDHLNQVSKMSQTLLNKKAREYETIQKVAKWYVPQFLKVVEIYDLILRYFFNEESKDKNKQGQLTFQVFYDNIANLNTSITDKYLKDQIQKVLNLWKTNGY